MIAFWSRTEAESRTERTAPSTVLDVKKEPKAPDPCNLKEFLQAQKDDKLRRERSEWVGEFQFCFEYDRYGTLVLQAKLDGAHQRVMPDRPRNRLLHFTHYLVVAVQPCDTRMDYALREEYYSTQMASNVFSTVQDCQDCIRLTRALFNH